MPIISVHDANYLRKGVTGHSKKVTSLYKRALRDLESWLLPDKAEYRFQAVLLRQRFEENKDEKDMRKAKQLLEKGEEELWLGSHWKPIKYPYSVGGICYERYYNYPDWHLDYWHPLEKARYPHYFAKREQRKIEFIQLWESRYGKPAEPAVGVLEYGRYQQVPDTDEEKKYGPFTDKIMNVAKK